MSYALAGEVDGQATGPGMRIFSTEGLREYWPPLLSIFPEAVGIEGGEGFYAIDADGCIALLTESSTKYTRKNGGIEECHCGEYVGFALDVAGPSHEKALRVADALMEELDGFVGCKQSAVFNGDMLACRELMLKALYPLRGELAAHI